MRIVFFHNSTEVSMVNEVIRQIEEAEAAAAALKARTSSQAKQMVEEAGAKGRALLQQARLDAESNGKRLVEQAEARAAENSKTILAEAEEQAAALRVSEDKYHKAAEFVAERVMNS